MEKFLLNPCVPLESVSVRRRTGQARSRRGEGHLLANDILDAARAIVEDTGDEGQVTLQEIARRVGIAAPSIYRHFSGVAEIVRTMVGQAFGGFADQVNIAFDDARPPAEQLRRYLVAYVQFGRQNPQIYRLLFIRSRPSAVPEAGESAGVMIGQLFDRLARAAGLEPGSPELYARGVSLWFEVHGIVTLPPAHPRFAWPDDDELVRTALRRAGVPSGPAQADGPAGGEKTT